MTAVPSTPIGAIRRLAYKLVTSDTGALRFWFAWYGVVAGLSLLLFQGYMQRRYPLLHELGALNTVGVLFLVNGGAMLYGWATERFSLLLLTLEGWLGVYLWVGLALIDVLAQKALSITVVAACITLFLLGRYPTHWGRK